MSRRQLSTVLGLLALAIWGGVMSSRVSPTDDRVLAGRRGLMRSGAHPGRPRRTLADTQLPTQGKLIPSCPPGWRTPTRVPIVVFGSTRLKRGLNIREKISIL